MSVLRTLTARSSRHASPRPRNTYCSGTISGRGYAVSAARIYAVLRAWHLGSAAPGSVLPRPRNWSDTSKAPARPLHGQHGSARHRHRHGAVQPSAALSLARGGRRCAGVWGTLALDGGNGGRWAHCGVERTGAPSPLRAAGGRGRAGGRSDVARLSARCSWGGGKGPGGWDRLGAARCSDKLCQQPGQLVSVQCGAAQRGVKRCSLLRGCMAGGASDEVEPVVQTSSSARAVNEGRERGQRPDAARRGAAGRSARCVESPIALVR